MMAAIRLSLVFLFFCICYVSMLYASPVDRSDDVLDDGLVRYGEIREKRHDKHDKHDKKKDKDDKKKKDKHDKHEKHEKHEKKKKEHKHKHDKKKHDKEKWEKVEEDLNKHSKDHYKTKKDDPKKKYPKHMKDKIKNGETLSAKEIDSFENEFGDFKNRSGISVTDLIDTINRAHDVILEESDILNEDLIDYRNNVPEMKGKKAKKKKHDHKHKRDIMEIKRDARRDRVYLWMDRIVPYEIDASLAESTDTIEDALAEIASKTCIQFVRHDKEKNWVKFVKKTGCWSTVGKTFWVEGSQELSLGSGCMYPGIIMHEIMHALGFYHEQSRPDRGQYIEIMWENILEGNVNNFERKDETQVDTMSTKYDFKSIMHYGKYAFAINGSQPTIKSIIGDEEIGQRIKLSETDVAQINELYSCQQTKDEWSYWSEFGPCSNDCRKERSRFCTKKDKTSCGHPISTKLLYYGLDVDEVICSIAECNAPVNGHWNKWGSWGECSVTCGEGMHIRKRECTDPPPKNGGLPCVGFADQTQSCRKISCSQGPFDCTFDVDSAPLCKWTSDPSGDFKWIRNSGRTPSSSTGPSEDHTSGSGYYLYIESSSPAAAGWVARLVSAALPAGPSCMNLAYSMYGQSTGTLNVKVKDLVTGHVAIAFTKSGDQSSQWHHKKIEITAMHKVQVIIEGIRGSSFQGDIAIDDIIYRPGSCNSLIPTNPPIVVPTTTKLGCYSDKGYVDGKRPFPEYEDLRQTVLKWSADVVEMRNNFLDVVGNCSVYARANNFKYFAVQFYGECWTGNTADVNYGRDGENSDCYPEHENIVGKDFTMAVYKWDDLD